MKICPGCGAQCQDSVRFCTNCGTAFEPIQSPAVIQQNDNTQDPGGGWQQNGGPQDQYGYGGWQQNSGPQGGQYGYGGWQQNGGPQGQYGYGGWQQNGGPQGQYGYGGWQQNGGPQYNTFGIRQRSIALAVIFTLITFGIYGIYWMIRINDDVNQLANEPEATSGGLVFLFTLITFGIYGYYWLYKMGERCDAIRGEWNGSKSILYLVLGLVGLSIVSYALIQDVINKTLPMEQI